VYGGEDSSKFINGILGRLAEVHEAGGISEESSS
jgi:transcription termination factor NusB